MALLTSATRFEKSPLSLSGVSAGVSIPPGEMAQPLIQKIAAIRVATREHMFMANSNEQAFAFITKLALPRASRLPEKGNGPGG
jgi:hypothetical protein